LKVVLFCFKYPFTIAHANSMGLNSQWYGGNRSTVCPLTLAKLSITYDLNCGRNSFAIARSSGFNNDDNGRSRTTSLEMGHSKIAALFQQVVGYFSVSVSVFFKSKVF